MSIESFGDLVSAYATRRSKREAEDLNDRATMLQIASKAALDGNPTLANAISEFVSQLGNGNLDPIQDFLKDNYFLGLRVTIPDELSFSSSEENHPKEIHELVDDRKNGHSTHTFYDQTLTPDQDQFLEKYPILQELFKRDDLWTNTAVNGEIVPHMPRSLLTSIIVPGWNHSDDVKESAKQQKISKLANRWSEEHETRILGRHIEGLGINIFISRQEVLNFFSWLDKKPEVLSGYRIADHLPAEINTSKKNS